jgi:O-methyltransferase
VDRRFGCEAVFGGESVIVPDSLVGQDYVRRTLELAETTPDGVFVEVGVYKGGMAYHLAKLARSRNVALHLFDTFTGIPIADPDDNHRVGDFGDTSAEQVRALIPDAVFHVGVFPGTMPIQFQPVAFVHCDCDQYESVRSVIQVFWPIMVPGGVMVFDDMDTRGGRKAIKEAFEGRGLAELHGRTYVRKPL